MHGRSKMIKKIRSGFIGQLLRPPLLANMYRIAGRDVQMSVLAMEPNHSVY